MATPATMNRWLDELAASILNANTVQLQHRKQVQESFRRRVKKHNYGRTNQFEVTEHLDGLEEKFQILTLDKLSDALRQRRNELKHFENLWLPDVLNLFLLLSGNPARNESLLELYNVPPRVGTPPLLEWKDVLADDPINDYDRLWRIPDFRDQDDSSYDDDGSSTSSVARSLEFVNKSSVTGPDELRTLQDRILYSVNLSGAQPVLASQKTNLYQITEELLVRESLLFLRGFQSRLFEERQPFPLQASLSVQGIAQSSLPGIFQPILAIRNHLDTVKVWLIEEDQPAYVSAMKNAVEEIVVSHHAALDRLQQRFLESEYNTTVSVIDVVRAVEDSSRVIAAVADTLKRLGSGDSISCLETFFTIVQEVQLYGDLEQYRHLRSVLVSGLRTYLQPIYGWIQHGLVGIDNAQFFITSCDSKLNNLWHDRYHVISEGPCRAPNFLANTMQMILSCGKTASFIRHLDGSDRVRQMGASEMHMHELLAVFSESNMIPFGAAFEDLWYETVNTLLKSHTKTLKELFSMQYNLDTTFDALSALYLQNDGMLWNEIESKFFSKIDRCIQGWNNRFQLRDMLGEALNRRGMTHVCDSIIIHTQHISSRSMQSQRTSVKILSALNFEYVLTWPMQNIVQQHDMDTYRQIALMLVQLRRAKYCLEWTGYPTVMTVALELGADTFDQRSAQLLSFTLLNFVNTIYSHLTAFTITLSTMEMRQKMTDATTIDEMIEAHRQYMTRLEYSCFVAQKLEVLRQTLIALLDLCIRFADLVTSSVKARHIDSDDETSSFTSAISRGKTGRTDVEDSDEELDDGNVESGDGYSSFIILADGTSIVEELEKVQVQFLKHLKFFAAGLRGVSKAGQHVQDLEMLADRLDWILIR